MQDVHKYTATWIAERVFEKNAHYLENHRCGLCNMPVGFVFTNPGALVWYQSGCECSWSPNRPSSYQEVADWLAMQSSDEIRDKIMGGLLSPPTVPGIVVHQSSVELATPAVKELLPMNPTLALWIITQDVNNGYDTYDTMLVAAYTMDEARRTHPNGKVVPDLDTLWVSGYGASQPWATFPSQTKATYIGEAALSVLPGILMTSFNAG